jgi:phosphate transport system substrate-binding protein
VRNRSGKSVAASLESITAAAAAMLGAKQTHEPYSLHDLTYNLTDAEGPDSYPISGMSFAVLYQAQTGEKGKAVVAFLKWCTSPEGQSLARKRNFAPLPESLQQKVAGKLEAIEIR